ncbi:hypothetical protein BC834DRAFT_863487 [Gloeopeniophorella convolvens]|nr:hypothetical protein BC834DRAFT_863487 [Gloeopeniophorella convolvens]
MSIRAFTSFASDPQAQNWFSVIAYPVLFLSFQVLHSSRPDNDASTVSPADLAVVEALKLAFNIVSRYRSGESLFRRRESGRAVLWDASDSAEGQPLQSLSSHESDDTAVSPERSEGTEYKDSRPTTHSWLVVVCAAALWAGTAYITSVANLFFDVATVHLAVASSLVVVSYSLYALAGRPITIAVAQSIALQLLGPLLVKVTLFQSSQSYLTPSLVLLSVAFTSACSVLLIEHIYHSHGPSLFNTLNTALFFSGFFLHVVICIIQALLVPPSATSFSDWSLHRISSLVVRARLDWTILSVINDHDAVLERVLYSFSLTLLLLFISLHNHVLPLGVLAGSAVALWASFSYLSQELYKSHQLHDTPAYDPSSPSRRRCITAWIILSILGLGSSLGIMEAVVFLPERPRVGFDMFSLPIDTACQRRELPFSHPPATGDRGYRHFENILLVVFFSHPRYNTNLDYYREVYSEYFPNILFVGPASREDAGFNHSYDVLVDTYQASEDLSDPQVYKMGGRMAHHMLYTALQEHPCYDGYLWAPFDTLLNVPRLQLFDQRRFWYHSPFARYVHNPALGREAERNASYHAPSARISPDPANMTTPWKGWGEDWWWGSPHVGLPVCMPAYNKIPEAQRARLAALTGAPDRLVGGSADTMYIPTRHRGAFMSALALFLQTDCFLEIAAPTALHLALPRGEDILFVDHWWIWQAPFDTAFVRGKWAEGREVDTFHTFHWGEPSGADGAWVPHPERVGDVRRLLQDSAARQGVVSFPGMTS